MKSILPIIFIILLLTGAITYTLSKRAIPKAEENRFGIPANEVESNPINGSETASGKQVVFTLVTPTPSVLPPKVTTNQVSDLPTITEKGGEIALVQPVKAVTKTTKTIVCTPVYGQANTCTEHIVVDTGAQDAIFFNFAGLAYLAGLVSFVKAKTLKK